MKNKFIIISNILIMLISYVPISKVYANGGLYQDNNHEINNESTEEIILEGDIIIDDEIIIEDDIIVEDDIHEITEEILYNITLENNQTVNTVNANAYEIIEVILNANVDLNNKNDVTYRINIEGIDNDVIIVGFHDGIMNVKTSDEEVIQLMHVENENENYIEFQLSIGQSINDVQLSFALIEPFFLEASVEKTIKLQTYSKEINLDDNINSEEFKDSTNIMNLTWIGVKAEFGWSEVTKSVNYEHIALETYIINDKMSYKIQKPESVNEIEYSVYASANPSNVVKTDYVMIYETIYLPNNIIFPSDTMLSDDKRRLYHIIEGEEVNIIEVNVDEGINPSAVQIIDVVISPNKRELMITTKIKNISPNSATDSTNINIKTKFHGHEMIIEEGYNLAESHNLDSVVKIEAFAKNGTSVTSESALNQNSVTSVYPPNKIPTTSTFETIGNEVNLSYILNHYNLISKNNATSNHIVGPVIVQNEIIHGDTGVISISDYSKGISSFVGVVNDKITINYIYDIENGNSTSESNIKFKEPNQYMDLSRNNIKTINPIPETLHLVQYQDINNQIAWHDYSMNGYGHIEQNDEFFDFEKNYVTLHNESLQLLNVPNQIELIPDEMGYCSVDIGKKYFVSVENTNKIKTVNINTQIGDGIVTKQNTIINYYGTQLTYLPNILLDGKMFSGVSNPEGTGSPDYGEGHSFTWNMPNLEGTFRKKMENSDILGHVIAPNAEFENRDLNSDYYNGGNLNGSMVVKDFRGGRMEMHMFPYIGEDLHVDKFSATTVIKGNKQYLDENNIPVAPIDYPNFEFILKYVSGVDEGYIPNDNPVVSVDSDGTFEFLPLTFTKEGIYTFEVIEKKGILQDIIYDKSVFNVVIKVENIDGKLQASQTITKNGYSESLTNIEFVNKTGTNEQETKLIIEKTVSGTNSDKAKLFNFNVIFSNENNSESINEIMFEIHDEFGSIIQDKTNYINGKETKVPLKHGDRVIFTNIEIGTEYVVSEDDYTADSYYPSIISGNLDGHFDEKELKFIHINNIYAKSIIKENVKGVKTYNNGELKDDMFYVKMTQDENNPENGAAIANVIVPVTADSKYDFGDIVFTKPGTYMFYIEEVYTGISNVVYDKTIYRLTAEITENNGHLQGIYKPEKYIDGTWITEYSFNFTNKYVEDYIVLGGNKEYLGSNNEILDITDGAFAFKIEEVGTSNPNGLVINNDIALVNADGSFSFEPILISITDGQETADNKYIYNYNVYEVKGDNPLIEYDKEKYTIQITVFKQPWGKITSIEIAINNSEGGRNIVVYDDLTSPINIVNNSNIVFTNTLVKKQTTAFNFTKVDYTTHNPLKGAEFNLKSVKQQNPVINQTIISNDLGLVEFSDLNVGEYILTESKTPNGYLNPSGYWSVIIDPDLVVTISSVNGAPEIINSDDGNNIFIPNTLIFELPDTGGNGMLLYWVIGLLLFIVPLIIKVKRIIKD